jgi:hypothetical protein
LTALRNAIEPLMPKIMPLAGSPLGFLTDKDTKGGYKAPEIVDAIAEAMLRGLRATGNEFNIIKGKCYAAKNGLARLVKQHPGLTDLKMTFGVPKNLDKGNMIVRCHGEWKIEGAPDSLDTEIAVSVFEGNRDAAIGKATRKLLKQIYDRISGGTFTTPEGEVGDMDIIDVEGEVVEGVDDEVTKALEKAAKAVSKPPAAAQDPREPKEGAVPYDPEEPPQTAPEPQEPPLKPIGEAMFGKDHGGKIDGAAVRRLAGLAKKVIGDEWVEQVADWVRVHYQVNGMAELPASAELELMKWLDRE